MRHTILSSSLPFPSGGIDTILVATQGRNSSDITDAEKSFRKSASENVSVIFLLHNTATFTLGEGN